MSIARHLGLGSSLLLSLSFTAVAGTLAADRSGWIELAQAQTEDQKKKDQAKKKAPPAPPKAVPPKAAPPKAAVPPKAPPPKAAPTVKTPPPKGPPPDLRKATPPPPALPKSSPPAATQPVPPKAAVPPKALPPKPPAGKLPPSDLTKKGPDTPDARKGKRTPEGQAAPGLPGKAPPSQPGTTTTVPPTGPGSPALRAAPPASPAVKSAIPGPRRFEEVQKGRQERVEEGGRRRVIQEPGNRIIVKQDNRAIIRHDEGERFRRRPGAATERRPDGIVATSYRRRDGTHVVSEVDSHGRLVRRYRRSPDGREHNIIDNRRFLRNVAIGVGIGAVGLAILALAPPRVTIPREKYIVLYDRASEDDLYEALEAPPVEPLERAYSLDEIRDNFELRQRMRRIELGNISFEFGAWEIAPEEYPKLERLARVLLRILERNPDEVFLIEGHTDAVGSDVDNLSLSDRRAAAVAEVLSETFGVPPENLVTQGYGEQFLKVPTQGPEPLNRRVDVRRITPLMSER